MRKFIFTALAAILMAGNAVAGCRANDQWTGPDKRDHLVAGTLIATVATMHTASPFAGFLVGTGAGLAKEMLDATGNGDCTLQDFVATAVGAGVGAYLGGWVVTRAQGRTLVSWHTVF